MEITRTPHSAIAHLREHFLRENNIQFVLDKAHRYGWADSYAFSKNEELVGYGSVWGKTNREDRDAIFEFYMVANHRDLADRFFNTFCVASRASYLDCQSNDKFLFPMFEKFTDNKQTEAILFADDHTTNLRVQKALLVKNQQPNPDDCQFKLLINGVETGEGGFMLNYNFPYADLYFAIHEHFRGKGYGSFFVQELKKEIYTLGRIPAARCNVANTISKSTLLKAGMAVCGLRVTGEIKKALLVW